METKSSKSVPPAKVENSVQESQLTTVKLSPEAEKRLGIETTKVEYRKLPRAIKFGGEIISIPGRTATITAPMAGKIMAPSPTALRVGANVRQGQEVFRLLLLPAEKDVMSGRDDVEVKRAQYELAQSKAKRAEQLLQEKAVSQKAVEEAQTELINAESAYKAASARFNLLNNDSAESGTEGLSTMKLTAPVAGVLQKVHVTIGQIVSASALVFEVSSLDPVWVRVPIYVGDRETVDTKNDARVQTLGAQHVKEARSASPVQGPPLSDPNAASADLFFQMDNKDERYRLGEKVTVTLTQKSEEEGLIVPIAAILYDIEGGTWVYVKTSPQVYKRQRIEVLHMVGENALLARGPVPGKEVVITGAAEIFGTEFGAGK